MDSKGLDVCNSLERDKACWRCWLTCCCPMEEETLKEACHDGLDSLTVGLRALLAPAQFVATKPDSDLHRRDNTPLKHSAHSFA